MNVNESNCVLMDSFEEEAVMLTSQPFLFNYSTRIKPNRLTLLSAVTVALFAASFFLYTVTQHHDYIKHLRQEGAHVQTISASPSWMSQIVSSRNLVNNFAETIFLARLYGQSCNDKNLKELSKCSKLEQLELNGPNVSSNGFLALKQNKSLKRIELLACENISRKAIQSFNIQRPEVKIVVRGRAYIGMMAEKTDQGFYKIVWVGEKSPAQKAGIRVQDLVTGVNGDKLECYSQLHHEFNKLHPGDELDLQVKRENESVKVHVELGDILENLPS